MFKNHLTITICAILILIVLNVFCIRRGNYYKNEFYSQREIIDKQNKFKVFLNQLMANIELIYENGDFIISQQTKVFDEDKNEILLRDLIKGNNKIIFRYSQLGCMACVDKELKRIDNLAKKIGYDKIIVLATYFSNRDLYSYKRVNDIKVEMYNIPIGSFHNDIEKLKIPYIFIVNKTLEIKSLFIPRKDIPQLTEEYYKYISSSFENLE